QYRMHRCRARQARPPYLLVPRGTGSVALRGFSLRRNDTGTRSPPLEPQQGGRPSACDACQATGDVHSHPPEERPLRNTAPVPEITPGRPPTDSYPGTTTYPYSPWCEPDILVRLFDDECGTLYFFRASTTRVTSPSSSMSTSWIV